MQRETVVKSWQAVAAIILVFITSVAARAQELSVDNVRFQQRRDSKVIVKYDLIGDPSNRYTIRVSLFDPRSRETVPLDWRQLYGDVGESVKAGRGRRIGWDLLKDYPKGLHGDGYVFVIDVFANKSSNSALVWGGLGAAGAGALVYWLLSSGSQNPNTEVDLPGPPALP